MLDLVNEMTEETPTLRIATDGRLVVIVDGDPVPVRLRQCFPWSEPGLHLSLRDDEDREVEIIDDPDPGLLAIMPDEVTNAVRQLREPTRG